MTERQRFSRAQHKGKKDVSALIKTLPKGTADRNEPFSPQRWIFARQPA
jgi:hypothetical protein